MEKKIKGSERRKAYADSKRRFGPGTLFTWLEEAKRLIDIYMEFDQLCGDFKSKLVRIFNDETVTDAEKFLQVKNNFDVHMKKVMAAYKKH